MRKDTIPLGITAVALLLLAQPSYAYLDPGTGSALIQGLIATVAAVGVTLKLYWHRFVGLFSRSDAGDSDNDASTGKSPD